MSKKAIAIVALAMASASVFATPNYVPDEVLVVSRPGTPSQVASLFRNIEDDPSVAQIQEAFPGSVRALSQIKGRRAARYFGMKNVNMRRIKLKSGVNPETFSKTWNAGRIVKETIQFVQPNYMYKTTTVTPNDPFSSTGNNFIHLTHTDDAWDITTGTRNIIIAVIDTGTNLTHEDLSDSLWVNPNEVADGIDNDGNGYIDDINGANTGVTSGGPSSGSVNGDVFHGTHVAGIIAAKLNNSKGIAGVCPDCKLMTIKANIPNQGFFTTASLVAGVEYATEMGASIINMSLGGAPSSDDYLYHAAIQAATSADVVTVAAAGNESEDMDINPSIPAAFSEVIAVSATDGYVFDDSYSNYGSAVWVSAPGTDLASTLTGSNHAYGFASGTSMATPVVSGVIGLLKSLQPRLTVSDIKTLLQTYSDDLGTPGKDPLYGYGFINAYRLLSSITDDVTPPTIPSASIPTRCESNSALTVRIVATDNFVVAPIITATANFYTHSTLIKSEIPSINAIGNSTYELRVSTPGTTISSIILKLSAIDANNNRTSLTDSVVEVTDLTPPTVTTPNSYIDDQLAGLVTLNIQDISGIATTSIRVAYTTTGAPTIRTIASNPLAVSLNGSILQISLPDLGYIPSISGTLAIYSSDLLGNAGTQNIGIGSAGPPAITWLTINNDFLGEGSAVRFTITDSVGVSLNTLNLTFITATRSVVVAYAVTPNAFSIASPTLSYTVPSSLLPASATMDIRVEIKNRLLAESTQSVGVRTNSTLSAQTVGSKSQLLAYPNPVDPRSTTCVLAYNLSRAAVSGQLIIYDLRYHRVHTETITSPYLLAGYNEFPWTGKDDSGEIVPNGTYIAVVMISDDTGTLKLRQKIAVLKR